MEQMTLCLRAGVTVTQRADRLGLLLGEQFKPAKSPHQTALLQALQQGQQPLDALCLLICTADSTPGDAGTALELADFILDFEE